MRRATAKITGSITIKPASKKIGKPNSNEAIPKAIGARFSPNFSTNVSAKTFAPPLDSTRRPIIAPSATSKATPPKVEPKPSIMTFTTPLAGMPVARAVKKLTTTKVMNACTRIFKINNKINATASAAMPKSVGAERVCVHPSIMYSFIRKLSQTR